MPYTTMRVKTVPRQRVIQDNRNIESRSETTSVKSESTRQSSNDDTKDMSEAGKDGLQGSNEDAIDLNGDKIKSEDRSKLVSKKDKETLKYSEEVLDMSIKLKGETSAEGDSVLLSLIAGPSCKYSNSQSNEDVKESVSNDDNNNILLPKTDVENSSAAGSSSIEDSGPCENELTTQTSDDSDKPSEALNLCKRDCQDEDDSNHGVCSDEKLKDTFLYKIMTDPTFLENIQKHKQTKRYTCPYCKQEFNNSDEQADHMDAKKDESNQVVCCACKKTFAQKRYLRYHQRCHSERTMFTCDICTKKYTRIDNLSRHNAFHVNPDKFSCNCCEKTFARKDLLNKHLKCHDNKYRFFCEICQRYFKGPLSLENHKKNFHSKAA
ncbi:GDNF-inducible zinc finger protein 1-like isoform X1 [Bombus pascuorum]|uniref:GDNF-inducible zinc finger protein 1-like isoform X1 n=2 Tax=Bombus pascuorum TaxID=65598 RepID=UPI00212B1A12|nr:GDNF-inducible zinc finger protein 1-like isoform X1 [Bombus pascuorum]